MRITSKPTSDARANRGTGNTLDLSGDKAAKFLDHRFRGKPGTYVHVDGVGVVELSEAVHKHGYDLGNLTRNKSNRGVSVKNYEHFNKGFAKWHDGRGRYIQTRADYEKALHEEGMVTADEADRTGLNSGPKHKDYVIENDTKDLINSVTPDKHGRIKPSDRAIEKLLGKVDVKQQEYNRQWLPETYSDKGGWSGDKDNTCS